MKTFQFISNKRYTVGFFPPPASAQIALSYLFISLNYLLLNFQFKSNFRMSDSVPFSLRRRPRALSASPRSGRLSFSLLLLYLLCFSRRSTALRFGVFICSSVSPVQWLTYYVYQFELCVLLILSVGSRGATAGEGKMQSGEENLRPAIEQRMDCKRSKNGNRNRDREKRNENRISRLSFSLPRAILFLIFLAHRFFSA